MYTVIWEYHIKMEYEKDFLNLYGKEGEWVHLFEEDDNYFESDLIKDVHQEGRYLTIDYWIDKKSYDNFRNHHNEIYQELDMKGSLFCHKEKPLGEFNSILK